MPLHPPHHGRKQAVTRRLRDVTNPRTPPLGVIMSYEIRIASPAETGDCTCSEGLDCFHETAAGPAAVQQMWWHAVQHSMATGHQVNEHLSTVRTVVARGDDY